MTRVQKGIMAGLAATLVVSVLEIVKQSLGFMPQINFPRLLAAMLFAPGNMIVGWGGHLVVGTLVLGPLFGLLCRRIPTDTPESKGILFAVGAWLVMMLTVAPLSGIGMFGIIAGFWSPVWTLFLHLVYGIVLGMTWSWLNTRDRRMAHEKAPGHGAPAL